MKALIKPLYKIPGKIFLLILIVLAYVPFLNLRVLRMAGDEKVYISQAIEMARDGRWFIQTLADEPNYFKGPLHYILIRVGMIFFGNHLFSALWMNFAFALIAGFSMYSLANRRWGEKSGVLLGTAAALNVGIYSHAFASQMEVELWAFYTLAAAVLGFGEYRKEWPKKTFEKHNIKNDFYFWFIAGLASWIKSPIYSVFIGFSGICYWFLTQQLTVRLRSWRSWLAVLTGVFVAVIGFAPAFFFDRENFIDFFVFRENLSKANIHRSWDYVMTPLTYFSFPWTFVIVLSIYRFFKKKIKDIEAFKLGLCIGLPSMIFWCLWTYKGQNYNLPNMIGLFIASWALFNGEPPKWCFRPAGFLGFVCLIMAARIFSHFWPLPGWWPVEWIALGFLGLVLFSLTFTFIDDARALAVGTVCLFISFAAFIVPPGQREMIGIRGFLKQNPQAILHYYNLDPSIWSEWGILQLVLNKPVFGLHKPSQLKEATQPGHAVLIKNREWVEVVLDYLKKNKPEVSYEAYSWKRWLTKGRTRDGSSRWKVAWQATDLSLLEREFTILWFPK